MSALAAAILPSLAWALLDFVWQGLLVGWICALLFALLRKASPHTRYAVGCGALLLCAALPLAGVLERLAEAHDVPTTLLPLALADGTGAAAAGSPAVVALAADRVVMWQQFLQDRLPLVLLLWGCGAAALAARMLLGLWWVRRRSDPRRSRPHPQWQQRVDALARQLGVTRAVRLGVVDDLPSPVTAGCWRPVILLPASLLTGMPAELLEALLAHEMAHIRRYDYLVNLLQSAIEIVLFYHPTIWWLSNRVRIEREQIADDLAASTLGEPRRLALALSELDRFQLTTTPHLAHAAHGGNLMSRIKRLVRPESEPLNWKMAVPVLGLGIACIAFYANAQTPATPATPAIQATPATPPVKAERHHPRVERSSKRTGDAFALVRPNGHGVSMHGSDGDWRDIEALKKTLKGDFIWFRDEGKEFIVQDPGVLAKVIDAYAPVDKLGAQMNVYGEEMNKHGEVMNALGKEMEKAAGNMQEVHDRETDRKMREFGREQGRLGRQMDQLGRQLDRADDKKRAQIERDMDKLGEQMNELGRQMGEQGALMAAQGEKMRERQGPMEEIGRKMKDAGKPMDELGKKMGVLGKQMEEESRKAEATARGVIKDAKARGLAQPVPQG